MSVQHPRNQLTRRLHSIFLIYLCCYSFPPLPQRYAFVRCTSTCASWHLPPPKSTCKLRLPCASATMLTLQLRGSWMLAVILKVINQATVVRLCWRNGNNNNSQWCAAAVGRQCLLSTHEIFKQQSCAPPHLRSRLHYPARAVVASSALKKFQRLATISMPFWSFASVWGVKGVLLLLQLLK